MLRKKGAAAALVTPLSWALLLLLLLGASLHAAAALQEEEEDIPAPGHRERPYRVKKEQRKSLVVTEYGEISAAEITCGTKGPYHLQFITLEPNSLFLPVLLHADMVFYVHTGSGRLSWTDDGKEMRRIDLRRGDAYRLQPGSLFFLQSNLDPDRQKLRLYAIFSSTDEDIYEPSIGAYSSIKDLILGFDKRILQSAFKVSKEVIKEITGAMEQPAIVHADKVTTRKKSIFEQLETRLLKALVGGGDIYGTNGKHKKKTTTTFNILEANPDFENCNGWSLTVDQQSLRSLRGSNIGIFMVNLTKGSMMAPHWNPMATEIAIVLYGQGIVRMVCASSANASECKNMRFRVTEGDVFAVPRFHPMAQMSFNNDSFVFMGFSTSTRRNYPQFLTGRRSVFQTMDRDILAMSFNVTNSTISQLLTAQEDEIILDCTSCAEEEARIMEEEKERERQEEEARKREEERKRQEEEARKREEEARKREEEEARKREEEEARKREEEEARKREEEEARRREEEETRKREEEEARRREEEEARRREEEEARKRKEEEEARKREEEEQRRQQEAAQREQEEARRQEEERQRRKEGQRRRQEAAQREQEEARRQEEERQRSRQAEEEEARKEQKRREEEEQRKKEEGEGQPEEAETEQEHGGGRHTGPTTLRKVWKVYLN